MVPSLSSNSPLDWQVRVPPREDTLELEDTTSSLPSLSLEDIGIRKRLKCVDPVQIQYFTAERISHCLINFITFLNVKSIKALGQSNRDWNRVISTPKVYPGSTKNHSGMHVSLILFCCVQQFFRHSEKKPLTGRELLRISRLEKRFNINILSSLEVRHFHRRLKDYHASKKWLEVTQASLQGLLPMLQISEERLSKMSWEELLQYSLKYLTQKNVDTNGRPFDGPSPLMRSLSKTPLILAIFKQLESSGLAQLQAFPALQSLVIEGCPRMDIYRWENGTACRQNCGCRVTNIHHVASLLALQSLTLHKTYLKDTDLSALKDLKLQSLTLIKCEEITAAGLMQLPHLSLLQRLNVRHCKRISTAELAEVESLTVLKSLDFNNLYIKNGSNQVQCDLDDLSLTFISLQHLAFFTGHRPRFISPNHSLALLTTLSALRSLDLSYSCIDDRGLAMLANCVALEYLSIDGCSRMTKEGIANLHALFASQKRQLQIVKSQYTEREVNMEASDDDEGLLNGEEEGELRFRPDLQSSEDDNDEQVSNDEGVDEGDEGDEGDEQV